MADNKIIHELLKEVRDDQKEANEKAQAYREDTIKWRVEADNRLDSYNSQLEIHIDGVKTLKELHIDNVTRKEILEQPGKTLNTIKKWCLYLGAISGAIAAIAKVIGLF